MQDVLEILGLDGDGGGIQSCAGTHSIHTVQTHTHNVHTIWTNIHNAGTYTQRKPNDRVLTVKVKVII